MVLDIMVISVFIQRLKQLCSAASQGRFVKVQAELWPRYVTNNKYVWNHQLLVRFSKFKKKVKSALK